MTLEDAEAIKSVAVDIAEKLEHGPREETVLFAACLGPLAIQVLLELYNDCLKNTKNSEI